jgi:hypothetical protein
MGDTVSRTLIRRLPHALLIVKWEIKDNELSGLRVGRAHLCKPEKHRG